MLSAYHSTLPSSAFVVARVEIGLGTEYDCRSLALYCRYIRLSQTTADIIIQRLYKHFNMMMTRKLLFFLPLAFLVINIALIASSLFGSSKSAVVRNCTILRVSIPHSSQVF